MAQRPKYFIVEADKLPEVFLKVVQAKRMLELREVNTINEAAQRVGISRSAFYKYKDAVMPFNDMMSGHIVTFQSILRDERCAVLNPEYLCHIWGKYPHHQPVHSGQRLRRGDHSAETSGLKDPLERADPEAQ